MVDQTRYYEQYVRPEEFSDAYYQNPKYFDRRNNEYVAYKDSEGYLTFGPGVKVDDQLRRQTGLSSIIEGTQLPRSVIDAIALNRWNQAVNDAKNMVGASDRSLPVAEMVYQMGDAGVRAFENTLDLINRGQGDRAAAASQQSEWARQTPARAARVGQRIAEFTAPPKPMRKPVDAFEAVINRLLRKQ